MHRIEIDFSMHLYIRRRPLEAEHVVVLPQGGKSCDRRTTQRATSSMWTSEGGLNSNEES